MSRSSKKIPFLLMLYMTILAAFSLFFLRPEERQSNGRQSNGRSLASLNANEEDDMRSADLEPRASYTVDTRDIDCVITDSPSDDKFFKACISQTPPSDMPAGDLAARSCFASKPSDCSESVVVASSNHFGEIKLYNLPNGWLLTVFSQINDSGTFKIVARRLGTEPLTQPEPLRTLLDGLSADTLGFSATVSTDGQLIIALYHSATLIKLYRYDCALPECPIRSNPDPRDLIPSGEKFTLARMSDGGVTLVAGKNELHLVANTGLYMGTYPYPQMPSVDATPPQLSATTRQAALVLASDTGYYCMVFQGSANVYGGSLGPATLSGKRVGARFTVKFTPSGNVVLTDNNSGKMKFFTADTENPVLGFTLLAEMPLFGSTLPANYNAELQIALTGTNVIAAWTDSSTLNLDQLYPVTVATTTPVEASPYRKVPVDPNTLATYHMVTGASVNNVESLEFRTQASGGVFEPTNFTRNTTTFFKLTGHNPNGTICAVNKGISGPCSPIEFVIISDVGTLLLIIAGSIAGVACISAAGVVAYRKWQHREFEELPANDDAQGPAQPSRLYRLYQDCMGSIARRSAGAAGLRMPPEDDSSLDRRSAVDPETGNAAHSDSDDGNRDPVQDAVELDEVMTDTSPVEEKVLSPQELQELTRQASVYTRTANTLILFPGAEIRKFRKAPIPASLFRTLLDKVRGRTPLSEEPEIPLYTLYTSRPQEEACFSEIRKLIPEDTIKKVIAALNREIDARQRDMERAPRSETHQITLKLAECFEKKIGLEKQLTAMSQLPTFSKEPFERGDIVSSVPRSLRQC